MADTPYSICSRALTLVGANVITSFDDGTAEAITAGQHYESQVDAHMSFYRWRFATKQASLVQLATAPTARWGYAYQLPTDLLVLNAITRSDTPIEYDRYGTAIYTDENDGLTADYVARVAEASWPPYFTLAIQNTMAAIFALSLARDATLSMSFGVDLTRPDGGPVWARARNADSQQQTTRAVPAGRLLAGRAYGPGGTGHILDGYR